MNFQKYFLHLGNNAREKISFELFEIAQLMNNMLNMLVDTGSDSNYGRNSGAEDVPSVPRPRNTNDYQPESSYAEPLFMEFINMIALLI